MLQDAAGNTLMHSAVSGSEDIPDYVLALAEEGVPINSANKDHDTALHIAARQGHLQVNLPHACAMYHQVNVTAASRISQLLQAE